MVVPYGSLLGIPSQVIHCPLCHGEDLINSFSGTYFASSNLISLAVDSLLLLFWSYKLLYPD
jgi:hypothetical protein